MFKPITKQANRERENEINNYNYDDDAQSIIK